MIGQGRPKLLVVDELAVTSTLDPYLSMRALASYSGCSVRWLRDRLTDLAAPLPCYRQVGRPDVAEVVSTVLRGLTTPPKLSP